MSLPFRPLAFFVFTLLVLGMAHWLVEPTVEGLVDGLLSSLLLLTFPFYLGDLLARRSRRAAAAVDPRREMVRGLAAAALAQALIWAFWLSLPSEERYGFAAWISLGHPLLALLLGFGGLPGVGRVNGQGGGVEGRRLLAADLARLAGVFGILGIGLQLVRGDRWQLLSPFALGLPVGMSALLFAGAAGCAWFAGRRRWALAASLAAFVAAIAAAALDYRLGECPPMAVMSPESAASTRRIANWNVGRTWSAAMAERVASFDADLVVLTEAGAAEYWTRALPGSRVCAPGYGIVVLARQPIRVCEPKRLDGAGRAVLAVVEGQPELRVLAVDVDGDPLGPRRRPIGAIARLARAGSIATVVVGDFNTPRRAWGVDPLRRSHANAFAQAGLGWAGTWPAPLPLFDLDQVWLPPERPAACARTLAAGGSDHRPVVVDLKP